MICREHLFAALTSDFPLSMPTFRIGWMNLLFWKVQNPKITWGISNSVLDSMECKTISVNGWLTFTLKIDSWYHMLSCGFRVNVSATKAAHHFKTSKMQDFVELHNCRSFFFFGCGAASFVSPVFAPSSFVRGVWRARLALKVTWRETRVVQQNPAAFWNGYQWWVSTFTCQFLPTRMLTKIRNAKKHHHGGFDHQNHLKAAGYKNDATLSKFVWIQILLHCACQHKNSVQYYVEKEWKGNKYRCLLVLMGWVYRYIIYIDNRRAAELSSCHIVHGSRSRWVGASASAVCLMRAAIHPSPSWTAVKNTEFKKGQFKRSEWSYKVNNNLQWTSWNTCAREDSHEWTHFTTMPQCCGWFHLPPLNPSWALKFASWAAHSGEERYQEYLMPQRNLPCLCGFEELFQMQAWHVQYGNQLYINSWISSKHIETTKDWWPDELFPSTPHFLTEGTLQMFKYFGHYGHWFLANQGPAPWPHGDLDQLFNPHQGTEVDHSWHFFAASWNYYFWWIQNPHHRNACKSIPIHMIPYIHIRTIYTDTYLWYNSNQYKSYA